MLVDWFTVCAQIVNFIVLVWLLRRYLYAPILRAVDERDKKMKAQVDGAKALNVQAKEEREHLAQRQAEMDQNHDKLLEQAQADAAAERSKLLDAARTEATGQRKQMLDALDAERKTVEGGIARRTQTEVFSVARKALADLADADLNHSIADAFLKKMRALPSAEKKQIQAAFRGANTPVVVRSGFDLPPADQGQIKAAVAAEFDCPGEVEFKTTKDVLAGIELQANGHSVSWNLDAYLRSLETNVEAATRHPEAEGAAAK